jgi:hypothetical protein
MNNVEILARVKDDLRKGIEVTVGVNSDFYSGNIEYRLRKILFRYPQLSKILSPIIDDINEEFDCDVDVYFVIKNDIVSVQIDFLVSTAQFDIDISTFDSFCDEMIDVGVFMTAGRDI